MERLEIPLKKRIERIDRGPALLDIDDVIDLKKVFDRLAAYENTGLMPEDVTDLMAAHGTAILELSEYRSIGATEHLKELAQAEKDRRLVVLPDVKYTDADGEKALRRAMWTCGNTNNPVTRYAADAIAEKLCREAKEDNPPLTPEELREMDGEPVWIETTDVKKANRWSFVDVGCEVVRFFDTRCGVKCTVMGNHFRTYGKTWLAYRRKPEEGTE